MELVESLCQLSWAASLALIEEVASAVMPVSSGRAVRMFAAPIAGVLFAGRPALREAAEEHVSLSALLAEGRGVSDKVLDVALGRLDDPPHHRIGFRMNARGIERVVAVRNAKEAGALLERLRSQSRDLFEGLAGAERTMGVAV